MRARFWGTRGSLARPSRELLGYGGNTACVEVRGPEGELIVLDCGTGAFELGQRLLNEEPGPIRGHLPFTHTHWDHIQGFPFFMPLFAKGAEWDVYAPRGLGQNLERTLAGQMEYTYFPVTPAELGGTIRYHELVDGSFEIGSVRVTTCYLNHPAVTLGYRLEAGSAALVYATNHEPHDPRYVNAVRDAEPGRLITPSHREDQRHVDFLADADLVIHDAQYLLEEYGDKLGWGHTPAEVAVDFAAAAGAWRLAIFHHDPLRDDGAVDALIKRCRKRADGYGTGLDVFGAREGQEIELDGRSFAAVAAESLGSVEEGAAPLVEPSTATVLIVVDDPGIVDVVAATLEEEGYRLLQAWNGEEALRLARAERPDLILLDWRLPGPDGLDVCRALRASEERHLREVPIVLVTGTTDAGGPETGFAAGVTDYLLKPFSPANLRSRVRAWLLR